MRLHDLEIRAFGPFAETVRVDFEALGDGGLFLLCGPTGSGKTSVLDAVSFALFGQVPGDRDKAKRLRSDHAEEGIGPRVVLEVTLRGRRIRITRSPEWHRPKKRGTGRTKEPAKVLLEEHLDHGWEQRSSRIDEAADLIGGLVGMTATQFCQVALLPQGQFETFLKAGSQERHSLLERLFDAQRFRAIEDWLVEHRKTLGRASSGHEARCATVVARIVEAGGAHAPTDDDGSHQVDERAVAWSARVRDTAVGGLAAARTRRHEMDLTVKRARSERDAARALTDLQRRHADALARRERLDALTDDTRQLSRQVADARRAETVTPLAELHDESVARSRNRREQAVVAHESARSCLPGRLGPQVAELFRSQPAGDPTSWPVDDLATAVTSASAEVARLTALLPTQAEIDETSRLAAAAAAERAARQALREEVDASRGSLREQSIALRAELDVLEARAQDPSALRQQLQLAEQRLAAVSESEQAEARRREVAAEVLQATEQAQQARETWLDIRQRRLDGMAAELASALTSCSPCPVCGSCEHPAPASPARQPVTADDEHAAEERYHEREETRRLLDDQLREAEAAVASARGRSGGLDGPAARAERDEGARLLEQVSQDRHRRQSAQQRLDDVVTRETEAAARSAQLDAEVATLHERVTQLDRRLQHLRRTLSDAIGAADTLSDRLDVATETESGLQRLAQAVLHWRDACVEQSARARRLDDALHTQGFDDIEHLRATALSGAELSALESLLTERVAEQRQVDELLDDPALAAAAAEPPAAVEQLEQRLADLEQQRDATMTAEAELARRADRLERLHSELDAEVCAWQPVRASLSTAAALAALCAGTSADNPDRVRLSSYVLAARLSQVVDAANERLDRMTTGRYLLEHTDSRGVGDRRGGLGLRVRDGWTGESRDPATLSGGESFIASLALALGLADVVAYEAGGVELGTLFVDEGFGSLDADTLDEVMDVLDDLRSGGRVVGLVSHVAELRSRVGAQLQVRKTRTGSTLAQL